MALTTFVAGNVLTAAQLNDSFAAVGNLRLIKTQTIGTAVSSVAVTNAFSSSYEAYVITVTGGAGSTTPIELRLTLGATATGYTNAFVYNVFNSTGPAGTGTTTGTYFGFAGFSSTFVTNAMFHLFNPFEAKYTTYKTAWTSFGSSESQGSGSGFLANTTSYTDFTLTCSTGTLTGGTVRVYGYTNTN